MASSRSSGSSETIFRGARRGASGAASAASACPVSSAEMLASSTASAVSSAADSGLGSSSSFFLSRIRTVCLTSSSALRRGPKAGAASPNFSLATASNAWSDSSVSSRPSAACWSQAFFVVVRASSNSSGVTFFSSMACCRAACLASLPSHSCSEGTPLDCLIEPVKAGLCERRRWIGQRRSFHRFPQAGSYPFKRSRAQFRITILQFRIKCLPEVFEKAPKQVKSFQKPGKAVFSKQRLGKPGRNLEVLAAIGESLDGQLDDQGGIGLLHLVLPFALLQFFFFPAGFFDFVVKKGGVLLGNRSVAETLPARFRPGDRIKKIVRKKQYGQGAADAGANSNLRNSRKGYSSPSRRSIFWPTGTTSPSSSTQAVARPSRTPSSGYCQEKGERAGKRTSPSSMSLNEGPVRTTAGAQIRSRSRCGACISTDARCSNGIQR